MRVLFINPPYPGLYQKLGFKIPPLGLAYIAAILEKKGFKSHIIDLNLVKEKIDVKNYDAIGISTLTPTIKRAIEIAKQIKSIDDEIPIVMGGPHATIMDKQVLETGFVDFVVRGEGEYTFLYLLEALEGIRDFKSVDGISYMEGERYIRNNDSEFIEDLDNLPFPARHLLKLKKYTKHTTTMISSRGCPFSCSFCTTPKISGRKWRARSPKNVVDEMLEIRERFGFENISFVDDNFTLDPSRVIEICEEIERRKIDISWGCESRVDTIVNNPSMVKKMANAGCNIVFLGVESANQKVLDDYDKKIDVNQIQNAFKILRESDIEIWASFIIGNPDEDKEMIENTIEFAKNLDPDVAQFSILTPYPGTLLYEKVKEMITRKDFDFYDGLHAVMRTKFLKPKEIEEMLRKAYKKFYLRPKKILRGAIEIYGDFIRTLDFKISDLSQT